MAPEPEAPAGLLLEYASPEALAEGVRTLRCVGLERLDALTPFPVPAVETALGLRRSPVPALVLLCGLLGALSAYALMTWINVVDYPLDVGNRPAHSGWAFVPVTLEAGILGAGLAAFFGWLVLCRLPDPAHPVHTVDAVRRLHRGRFFLQIDGTDPAFDRDLVVERGQATGAIAVHRLDSDREAL